MHGSQGGTYGKPCTCKGIFSGLTGLLQQALHGSIGKVPEKHRRSLQKIIPDLLIDRMDTQVQRPEFPQAPEPAWGSTKASAQDDEAMDAHHYHHPPQASTLVSLFLCWLKPDPPRRGGAEN